MEKISQYHEILELHVYCQKIGVHSEIKPMFDGFRIDFPNGGDFIQHHGSYGNDCGCVEPCIGCRLDYTAVELKKAKSLVRRYKRQLNRRNGGAE